METTQHLTGAWPVDVEAPSKGRLLIDDWSSTLDHDVLQLARLLVSELISLSVRGDVGAGTHADVELIARRGERALRAEVLSRTDCFSFPDATSETADLSLTLLDALADRWGLTATGRGTVCWIEIDC